MEGVPFVNTRYTKGVPFLSTLEEELHAWAEPHSYGNVIIYPSEKIWLSRERTPSERPSVRTTAIPM